MVMDSAVREALDALAEAIARSPEARAYAQVRQEVRGDAMNAAIAQEYRRMQTRLQVSAMSGQPTDAELTSQFQRLSVVLNGNPTLSAYVLSEITLQQTLAEVFQRLTSAAGIDIEVPVA